MEIEGYYMFKVAKKLKKLKYHMRNMAWKNGNLQDRVEKCRGDLKAAQKNMEMNPYDDHMKAEEANCLALYIEALNDEESLLFQQAKIDWISKGDRNNKYFHKILKSRSNTSRITSICNEKGERFEGKDVAAQFVNHFKNFLGASYEVAELNDTICSRTS